MHPSRYTPAARQGLTLTLALGALLLAGAANAQPRERDGGRDSGRGDSRAAERHVERGGDPGGDRGSERLRPGPSVQTGPAPRRGEPQRWFDGAHGHNHYYPRPGWAVRTLPPRASVTFWGGVGYNYFDGIWYTGGPHGYVVVRPPIGIVITDRPALATVLAIGGLSYLYVNGVYYRELPGVGFEVVPPPVEGDTSGAPAKSYIYPKQAQSAEQQATDEYECHRWAVTQTGFDPTDAATGQSTRPSTVRRSDYERARGACLEGRGYTVR